MAMWYTVSNNLLLISVYCSRPDCYFLPFMKGLKRKSNLNTEQLS